MITPSVQAVGAAAAQAGGAPQFASLYVGDLDPDVSEAMLYEIFNSVGPVASIRVCRDSVTRRSLGYAYVNFHSSSDAERVMDTLNYSTIKGRCCRIMWSHRDPNLRKTGNGNVFVKNLDKNVDNKALYDTFSLFGNILSCKVAVDSEAKSKGYGFVHYETAEAAKQAIEKVNNMQIGEKTVYVGEFLPREGRAPAEIVNFTNIYVKNFPNEWEEERLLEEFKPFGTITSSMMQRDKKDRAFAFINFENAEEAAAAITAMHRKDLRTEEEKVAAPFGRDAKGEPLTEADVKKAAAVEKGEEKKEEEKKEANEEEDNNKDNKPAEEAGEPRMSTTNEEETHPEHLLFVSRAMTKSERETILRAKFKSSAGSQPVGVNLYIKNLPDDCTDEALREMFAPFGSITSARVMHDQQKRSKGFGFVCYRTPEEATKAVSDMHLKTIKGKPLYVGLAEKKEERTHRLAARYKGEKGAGPGMLGMGGQKGAANPMGVVGYDANGLMMNQFGAAGKGMGAKGLQPGMMMYPQQGLYQKGQMMPGPMGGGQQGIRGGPMVGQPGVAPQNGAQQGMANPMQLQQQNVLLQQQQMARQQAMMGAGMMQQGTKGMNPQQMMMQQAGMMQQGKGINPQQMMMQQAGMMQQGKGGAAPMGMQQVPGQQQLAGARPPQQMGGGAPMQMQGGQANALTAQSLASMPMAMQKQSLGEKLYPAVSRLQPDLAGKITGMMLEMDNSEVLLMLDSEVQLRQKVEEAVRVLNSMPK